MSERPGPTCGEVFDCLDDYLDGNLSPRDLALVSRHIHACDCCSRRIRFEAAVLQTLKSRLRRIEVPPHLLASVTQRLCLESDCE